MSGINNEKKRKGEEERRRKRRRKKEWEFSFLFLSFFFFFFFTFFFLLFFFEVFFFEVFFLRARFFSVGRSGVKEEHPFVDKKQKEEKKEERNEETWISYKNGRKWRRRRGRGKTMDIIMRGLKQLQGKRSKGNRGEE